MDEIGNRGLGRLTGACEYSTLIEMERGGGSGDYYKTNNGQGHNNHVY